MARLGVLYSGGTDSSLAAILLERSYDVTLVTGTFGITDDWRHAREAGRVLDLPVERLELDDGVAHEAVDRIRADGTARQGIQLVHEHALERLAESGVDAVADGTRRDDRTPRVADSTARSLEDRHGVAYLAPLRGIGRRAIDQLAAAHLAVRRGPTETVGRGDYEGELRALLASAHGEAAVEECFPPHEQSVVEGRTGP